MDWKIQLSDIDIGDEEIAAVERVLRSKWLTMGETVSELEKRFSERMGVKHAFAVSNCTVALHLANIALNIGPGDEVVCPAMTFAASANASLYTGANIVFADIVSENDLTVSPEAVEAKITKKTKAVTVVHYAGFTCRMDEISAIAKKHGIAVIEDCAHAPFVEYASEEGLKFTGGIGAAGCFSFFGNKNIAAGEGGMITVNDDTLAERIRLLRSHGMTTLTMDRHRGHAFSYDVAALGNNYRFDEMRAAIVLSQMKKLDENNRKRRHIANIYLKALYEIPYVSIPFKERRANGDGLHIFPILLTPGTDRNKFMSFLRDRGIQTSIHYPPIHLFSYYRNRFGTVEGMLPVTEDVCGRLVTLPFHSLMTDDDAMCVSESVRDFFKDNQY